MKHSQKLPAEEWSEVMGKIWPGRDGQDMKRKQWAGDPFVYCTQQPLVYFFNKPAPQPTCLIKYKLSYITFDVHDYVILLNLWLQDDVLWISALVNKNQNWIWQNPQN